MSSNLPTQFVCLLYFNEAFCDETDRHRERMMPGKIKSGER